jgi:hypothetical protein
MVGGTPDAVRHVPPQVDLSRRVVALVTNRHGHPFEILNGGSALVLLLLLRRLFCRGILRVDPVHHPGNAVLVALAGVTRQSRARQQRRKRCGQ